MQGVKLRSLTWTGQTIPKTPSPILWATPRSPTEELRFYEVRPSIPRAAPLYRMFSVQYNHPAITGYSICWNMRILTIHAHKTDEDLAFYTPDTASQERATWVYVPLDPGDSIAEIWERSRLFDRELAILFKTSRGRLLLLGPQQRQSWGTCTWTLLDQPEAKPATICYDETGQFLAFKTPTPQQQSPPLLPEAPSPFPESTSLQDYFYSSAILDDVVEVTLCRPPTKKKVSGLLFRYADGRKACVGEIRLDYMDVPVPLSKLMALWLEFGWGDRGVFVRSVCFSRPLKESASQWFEVPICGLLEWWFSSNQCKIYHTGRASPATRM